MDEVEAAEVVIVAVAAAVVVGVVVLEEVEEADEVVFSKETSALQNLLQVSFRNGRNLPLNNLVDLVHSGSLPSVDCGEKSADLGHNTSLVGMES